MAAGPDGFVILPDPLLTRDRVISSTDDGAGRMAGPAVPADTNEGDLLPFMSGTPTADVDLDFRLTRAGGLYSAEWIWKKDTDASDQYRGSNAPEWPQFPHDPFADDARPCRAPCILVSTVANRILLFRFINTGTTLTWDVRYRTIGADDPTAWSSTTFAAERTITGGAHLNMIGGWELPDGAMRLLVAHGATTTVVDFDLYGSTDGGLTWTRIASDILDRFTTTGAHQISRMWVDKSRDWVRLCLLNGSTNRLTTVASGDRGATWKEIATGFPAGDTIYGNGETHDPRGNVVLIGNDSDDGLFILFIRTTSGSATGVAYIARRDENWSAHTQLNFVQSSTTKRIAGCRTAPDLVVGGAFDSGTLQGWGWLLHARADPTDNDYRTSIGGTGSPDFKGTIKYVPGFIQMAGAGTEIILFAALIDPDTGSGSLTDGTMCLTFRSRTRVSVAQLDETYSSSTWDEGGFWQTVHGKPDDDAETPYVSAKTSATVSWTADRLQLSCAGTTEEHAYMIDFGVPTVTYWADASAFGWLARVPRGSDVVDDRAAFRVVAAATTGDVLDVSVRMGTQQVVVYDNVAASTLQTSTVGLASTWHQFLLSFNRSGASRLARLRWAPIGDQSAWSASPSALTCTLGTSGLTSHQIIIWGLFAGTAGTTVQWREVGMHGTDDRGLTDFTSPTDLRGQVCSPYPAYVDNGLSVRWGGGGGFVGDTFDADLRYQYGVDQAFFDSPRQQFRSQTAVTQTWVFDADATYGTGRWEHQGAAVFGQNSREIVLQWDNGGSALALLTLSADLRTGLTIVSVDGTAVELSDTLPELEGVGLYMQISGGETPDPNEARTVRITRQSGAWVHAAGETQALADLGFTAGTTVALYMDRAAGKLSSAVRSRYLRLTMGGGYDPSAAGEAYRRLGKVVAGPVHSFDPPLSWQLPDNEEPLVTIAQAGNGVRVATEQGPPRRVLEGSLLGDVSGARQTFRQHLRHLSAYSQRPMAVVLDDDYPSASAMLARFTGASEHENEGWKLDSANRWRPVGNLTLRFEEET